MLDVGDAVMWLDDLAPWLTYVNLYFQGEPLLHPQLDTLIASCTDHNIYSSTSTNAHHLTEVRCHKLIDAGLSRLIISIDGLTQDTYSSYRIGGSLQKVMEGTQTMESLSTELLDYIIQVASGEIKTKSMENRQYDFLPWKRDISL